MSERWSPRQREMLAAMGVRLFERPGASPTRQAPVSDEPLPAGARIQTPAARQGSARNITRTAEPRGTPGPGVAGRKAEHAADHVNPDVATLDWPALREAVSQCRACALCDSRTQTVFGVGHPRARLMIVGEAPGENEDREGDPFVGQAGKLLDNMLSTIGLARDAATPEQGVYICNTLKCRPPRNRNPEPSEMARCAPYLERQIALVRPRLVLAMGRFAVQALLGSSQAIGQLRGRVHDRGGVPVIVTYHPAYLLRAPADKARAWEDLCLAASVLEQPAATEARAR